jgi:hypothetical protein
MGFDTERSEVSGNEVDRFPLGLPKYIKNSMGFDTERSEVSDNEVGRYPLETTNK